MRKLFRFFGKLAAGILLPIFILTAFTSILLLAFNSQLLKPDFYLEVFEEEEFFNRLPEIAAVQIRYALGYNPCLEDPENCEGDNQMTPSSQGGPPSYFQALSEKDWELLLNGLLPPEWVENQIEKIFGDLSNTIDTGEGNLSISISMLELKDHLSGEAGVEAIAQLLDAKSECSKEDLLDMTRILEGKEEPGKDFLSCRPPDDFIENHKPQLEVILRRSLRDVPDEIDLGKGLFEDSLSGGKAASITIFGYDLPTFMFIKWVRWGIPMSPLICAALLLLVALLAVHSFKSLGVWWGYPLAISGLFGFTLAMLVGPLANWVTNSFIADMTLPGFSPILIEASSDLAVQMIRKLFIQVRNYSLITAGMGLGIIIISSVIKSPGKIKTEIIDETESEEPEIEEIDNIETDTGDIETEEPDSEGKGKEPEVSDSEEIKEDPQ